MSAGRKAFFSVLHSARYGGANSGYIFAYDYNGVSISHIDPKKQGQNRFHTVYANGIKVVQQFVDLAKSGSGAGFIEYPFENGDGPVRPKLTLIQNVPEIGGLAGTGVYISDVNAIFSSDFS